MRLTARHPCAFRLPSRCGAVTALLRGVTLDIRVQIFSLSIRKLIR
jgi:hypothetical protein